MKVKVEVTETEAMSTCYFCGQEQTIINSDGVKLSTLINEAHWTGEGYTRVDHCGRCRVARRPRQKRQGHSAVVAATDWNYLVAFSGKGT